MSHLSSLWGMYQRQALRQSPMDWPVRCSTQKASGMDAHRRGSETVLSPKRTGRASLWHTQGAVGSQKIPAKGPCQRQSRVHSLGCRIQSQDPLSHILHIQPSDTSLTTTIFSFSRTQDETRSFRSTIVFIGLNHGESMTY